MAQIDKPNTYFNTVLYSGNNTSQSITGVNFQPDWVWLKERNGTEAHNLYDSNRGIFKRLSSNTTGAEYSSDTQLTSFDSDGFSVGSSDAINDSGNSMVGWNWKAGGTASSNTDGSITSSVSANTTSGFSVVTWTGTGANATIGHGISTPQMIILKNRDSAENWIVGNTSLGWTKYLSLNLSDSFSTASNIWQNTAPTSSVFSIGASGKVNGSGHGMVAYCFSEVKSFSKFGSYVSNANIDGTFVYTGFKVSFVMVKNTNSAGSWFMLDNKRLGYNPTNSRLASDGNYSESSSSSYAIDFVSNGFKLRTSSNPNASSGNTYIYMAFAENPLVGTNGIPTTAR